MSCRLCDGFGFRNTLDSYNSAILGSIKYFSPIHHELLLDFSLMMLDVCLLLMFIIDTISLH